MKQRKCSNKHRNLQTVVFAQVAAEYWHTKPEAALGVRGARADHDRAGPEYRYLDWYATANTDYVDYGTKDIQVLHYGI